MTRRNLLAMSEWWVRVLLALYPKRFREEFGTQIVETYRDRCRTALEDGGPPALAPILVRALIDSARNGLSERLRPTDLAQQPSRVKLRSTELRRTNRKVLTYSLGIAAAIHLTVFFVWSPEFVVESSHITEILQLPGGQGGDAPAFVEVLFGPPEIVTASGGISKEPPGRTLHAGRVVQLPMLCVGLTQWGDTPSSGRVRLRVNAAGRVDEVRLTDGTGYPCADRVIMAVAGSLWYHWLPDNRFPAPVHLEQPITLAEARDWQSSSELRIY